MNPGTLRVTIRTPGETVVDQELAAVRVPTPTGHVGLRPRCEPTVLAVEPGLIVLRSDRATNYAGTAGGLLHTDGRTASLLTPLAVAGPGMDSVSRQLDAVMASPGAEIEVRRTLGRLENRILQELHQPDDSTGPQGA